MNLAARRLAVGVQPDAVAVELAALRLIPADGGDTPDTGMPPW